MHKTIKFAKNERVDKQYYMNFTLTKDSAVDLLKKAEDFLVKMKLIIKNIRNEDIQKLREKLKHMI